MKTTFLILLNKIIYRTCKLFGKNGSAFPGSIIYKLDSDILNKIKYPKLVIGVTGSSGKGSTTEVIAHILNNSGYRVIYNKLGSNGIHGINTLILNNCNLHHEFIGDVLLLELDEKQIKLLFKKNTLTHLVVTNITRDQPARNINPDLIYHEIFDNIGPKTKLIINADDPIINKISLDFNGDFVTYGIDATKDSIKSPIINSIDQAYCPKCHKKLNYTYYHYGHLGDYFCPKCKFSRGNPEYFATDINLNKQFMKINNKRVILNKNIFYAAYYTLASYALCSELNIPQELILDAINVNTMESKRAKTYTLNNRKVNMLESKNENALSYYQSLKYITDTKGLKSVILGFDNVSRRYKYNDLSWLWDVDFELFNKPGIDKIICIGRFKYDVATRLQYAGIKEDKLILVNDLNELIEIAKKKTKGDIFTMVCFDMSAIIKNLLIKEKNNANN